MKTKPKVINNEELASIHGSPDWIIEEIDRFHLLMVNDIGLHTLIQIQNNQFVITRWLDNDE